MDLVLNWMDLRREIQTLQSCRRSIRVGGFREYWKHTHDSIPFDTYELYLHTEYRYTVDSYLYTDELNLHFPRMSCYWYNVYAHMTVYNEYMNMLDLCLYTNIQICSYKPKTCVYKKRVESSECVITVKVFSIQLVTFYNIIHFTLSVCSFYSSIIIINQYHSADIISHSYIPFIDKPDWFGGGVGG